MNMSREEIYNEVKRIIVDLFEIDEADVKPEAQLYQDLDIDSIDAVDLVVEVRKIIKKRINPEDFKSVRTVDDIVEAAVKILAEDTKK